MPDKDLHDTSANRTDVQADGENSAAPIPPDASGAQDAKGRKDGKPTREQRRPVNRELQQAVQAQVLAQERESERALAVELAKPVMGRPSEYTDERAEAICTWVARGKSLSSYCKEHGMGMETVYRWLRTRPDFRASYAQAHDDRADTLADEMLEIADQRSLSLEDTTMAKLAVETRKWIAAKLRPQKYGERQEVTHTGGVSIRIGIPQRPIQVIEAVDPGQGAPSTDDTPRQH